MANKTPAVPEPDAAPVRVLSAGQLAVQQDVFARIDELDAWADTSGLMLQILNAPTVDAARKVFETHDIKPWLNRPVEVQQVTFERSSDQYAGTLGVFALIKLVDKSTGEVHVCTCGAESVVAWLVRFGNEVLPCELVFTATTTTGGYTAYNVDLANF
jgi:hypothetical protein